MTLTVPVADSAGPTIGTWGLLGSNIRTFAVITASPGSTAWPTANQAFAVPFQISAPITISEMYTVCGTTPGTSTFDLGIYDESFTLLRSLGSTAAINTSSSIQPVGGGSLATPLPLARGRYYLAMSAAATTLTVMAASYANQVARAFGIFTMATAHPLPTTFVPASMGATMFIPTIFANTLTNVL